MKRNEAVSSGCKAGFKATVVKIKRDVLTLESTGGFSPSCGECKACSGYFKDRRRFTAVTKKNYRIGDEVSVMPPRGGSLLAVLLLILLPLGFLGIGIGIAVAVGLEELFVGICGVAGLVVGLLSVFVLDRLYLNKRYQFTLQEEGE